MKKRILLVMAIAASALLLAGCESGSSKPAKTSSTSETSSKAGADDTLNGEEEYTEEETGSEPEFTESQIERFEEATRAE